MGERDQGKGGGSHPCLKNTFKFNRMDKDDFRWGHPLYLARPCCDSGKRTKVAIASANFWLGGVSL